LDEAYRSVGTIVGLTALFSLPNALADGSDYDVTLETQPSGARRLASFLVGDVE
jgi:hypothetical protein